LLTITFGQNWPGSWSTIEEGREEVAEALEEGKICRIALEGDTVLGWIGGMPEYDGNVWQLHPLLVHPDHQGRGIGRALVQSLEEAVRARGAWTLHLGTDDETDMSSLSGTDLYPDVTPHIRNVRYLRGHSYTFYQKMGFTIVGVLPDALGFGKPDILMAKRVADWPRT
jgi:aminoglycoside 6'-N-acetyltransferase I